MKLLVKCAVAIGIFVLAIFANISLLHAEITNLQTSGEIVVYIDYGKEAELYDTYKATIQISLLSDEDDVFTQIEHLKEQSKSELEPLIKQYMLTVEMLTQLAVKTDVEVMTQQTKERLSRTFKETEKRIDAVLEHYRTAIDALIKQYTLQTRASSSLIVNRQSSIINHQFKDIAPGKYRLYGVITFATTTLRWFEPVVVKGGDRHTIYLKRDNLMNPYWTELNWWSFMNLDFSKHH